MLSTTGTLSTIIQALKQPFSTAMSSTFAGRVKIAQDTIDRTPEVIAATAGASDRSDFIKEQLPPLDPSHCPNPGPSTTVRIVGTDSFTAARDIIRKDPTAHGKTAVLNLASDEVRAGGWLYSYSRTQVCGITTFRKIL